MSSASLKHVHAYRALQVTLGALLCRIFHFYSPRYELPEGPCMVVSNHNADYDPIFLGCAFRRPMFFVASEHIFRWGIWSRLIVALFEPIARVKGSTDAVSALAILKKLRSGAAVCMFAEGDRSFNGVTGPIYPATGKLVKSSRASLVTYHISGGYLGTPRWARSRRHGPVEGSRVRVYSPQELAAMSADEINSAIQRDLDEDAFARQQQAPREYRGKNLAERLELALYLCPRCGRIGSLHSSGAHLFCDCGLCVTYDAQGFFQGQDAPFSCVRDWDRWQESRMAELARSAGSEPVFSDPRVQLLRIGSGHSVKPADEGTLSISCRELVCGATHFLLDEIQDMGLCGASHVVFRTADGSDYELRADPPCCGRKYRTFFQKVREGNQLHGIQCI